MGLACGQKPEMVRDICRWVRMLILFCLWMSQNRRWYVYSGFIDTWCYFWFHSNTVKPLISWQSRDPISAVAPPCSFGLLYRTEWHKTVEIESRDCQDMRGSTVDEAQFKSTSCFLIFQYTHLALAFRCVQLWKFPSSPNSRRTSRTSSKLPEQQRKVNDSVFCGKRCSCQNSWLFSL